MMAVQAAPQKQPSLKIVQTDDGKEFSVRRGATFTVTVPSNPSTGYAQCLVSTGEEPWVFVSRSHKAGGTAPGSPGMDTLTFRATKRGMGAINLVNVRPFALKETLREADPWTVTVKVN